jgi:hypothetical protein
VHARMTVPARHDQTGVNGFGGGKNGVGHRGIPAPSCLSVNLYPVQPKARDDF